MDKKVIRLTEDELHKIVKDATQQVLVESQLLTEMAYERSEFVSEAKSKITEIIRNYVLVVYARLHNLQTINHWRGELITLITDFQDMDTKPKSGNRKMVMKAIRQVWVNKMELNTHPQSIINKFRAKFNDEGLIVSDEEKMQLAQSFIDNMDKLINEMAYGNYNSALTFANAI